MTVSPYSSSFDDAILFEAFFRETLAAAFFAEAAWDVFCACVVVPESFAEEYCVGKHLFILNLQQASVPVLRIPIFFDACIQQISNAFSSGIFYE